MSDDSRETPAGDGTGRSSSARGGSAGRRRPARTPADIVLAARMAAVAAWVPVLMRVTSLPRAMTVLDPGLGPRAAGATVLERHLRVAEGLFRDARRRLGSNCMRRSLVLFRFLRRAGFGAEIVFGIKRGGDKGLDGHAWIELDGEPILEDGDPRAEFSVVFRYPPA